MKTAKDGHYYRDPRNGSYCWKIVVDGKPLIRKAKTNRELKTKVDVALKAINGRGTILEKVDREMTVGGFLTVWLRDFVKPSRAEKTYRQYEQFSRLYATPAIGAIRLDRLTSVDCQRFLNALAERGLSPTTVNLARTIVKRALNVARNQTPPLILANPMESTERVKAGVAKKRTMNGDGFDALIAECLRTKIVTPRKGPKREELVYRDGPLIVFQLSTGLRISEANALLWGDVDRAAGVIAIRRKLTWLKGGEYVFEVPKSDRSVRTIPLSGAAATAIDAAPSDRSDPGALLWSTESGRPVSPRNVQRTLSTILEAIKVDHHSLHDLRRSFGTHLARNRVAPHVLQEIMGHENIATTNKHYLTAFMGDMTAAMGVFGAIVPQSSTKS